MIKFHRENENQNTINETNEKNYYNIDIDFGNDI